MTILQRFRWLIAAKSGQLRFANRSQLQAVMSMTSRLTLVAVLAPLLVSCASIPSSSGAMSTKYFDRAGIDVVLAPGDVQTNYFKDTGSRERYCRSPQSDVASTFGEGFSLGLGLPSGTQKSIGEDVSRGAMSLGGRNPGVLIAREILYRACELSLNLNADTALSLKIYERFLQSLESVVKAQVGNGVAAGSSMTADPRISPLTNSTQSTSTQDAQLSPGAQIVTPPGSVVEPTAPPGGAGN